MKAVQEETRPGYKQTKLGWIPQDWQIIKIGKTGYIKVGRDLNLDVFSQEKTEEHIYPVYSNTVEEKGLYGYYSEPEYEGNSLTIVGRGVGLGTTFFRDLKYGAIGRLLVLYPNKSHEHRFLTYFINSRVRFFVESSGIPQLTGLQLATYDVAVPTLPEQKAIAQVLSTWDKAIEDLTQLITEKQQKKKALMQQLLTGKKRFPGFGGEWEEVKLGEYFNERKETNRPELELLSVGSRGVYPQSESEKKDTSNSDKSKYKRICKGDIGYNTMRMWQGRSALSELEGIVSPAYTIVTPKENADVLLFSFLFKFPYVIHRFFRNSQGLVRDTLNCKFKDFKLVKVFVPPTKEEQTRIAKTLAKADSEIKLLELKKNHLQDQKKGLMQQLLTGKKRLRI